MLTAIITALLLFTLFLFLIPLYLYLKSHDFIPWVTLTVKGLATLIPVSIVLFSCISINKNPAFEAVPATFYNNWWILYGMVICLAADVILELQFLSGSILFFFGHLCYITFLLQLAPFSPISIPVFAVFIVFGLCYFYPALQEANKKKIPCCIYGTTLALSASLGVVLPLQLGLYGIFPALATFTLMVSDILLVRNLRTTASQYAKSFALNCYYWGQMFMSFSVYVLVFHS